MTGIKSFYRTNDIEFPNIGKSGIKAQVLEKHKDIPAKEDLQEVIKICDPLEKLSYS